MFVVRDGQPPERWCERASVRPEYDDARMTNGAADGWRALTVIDGDMNVYVGTARPFESDLLA